MVQIQVIFLGLVAGLSCVTGQSLFYYFRNNHPSIFHQQTFYPNQQPFIKSLFGPLRAQRQTQPTSQSSRIPHFSSNFFPFTNFFNSLRGGSPSPPPPPPSGFHNGRPRVPQNNLIQGPTKPAFREFESQRQQEVEESGIPQPQQIIQRPFIQQQQGPTPQFSRFRQPFANQFVDPFGYYYTIGSGAGQNDGQAYTTVTFTRGSTDPQAPQEFRPLQVQDLKSNQLRGSKIEGPPSSSNVQSHFSIVNNNPQLNNQAQENTKPEEVTPVEVVQEEQSQEQEEVQDAEEPAEETQEETEQKKQEDFSVLKSVELPIDKLIGSPSFDTSTVQQQQIQPQAITPQVFQQPRPQQPQQQFLLRPQSQPVFQQPQQPLANQFQTPQFIRNRFVNPNFEFFPAVHVPQFGEPQEEYVLVGTPETDTTTTPEPTTSTTPEPPKRIRGPATSALAFNSFRRRPVQSSTLAPTTTASPVYRGVRRRVVKKKVKTSENSEESLRTSPKKNNGLDTVEGKRGRKIVVDSNGRLRRKKFRTTTSAPTTAQDATTYEIETKTEVQQSTSYEETPLIIKNASSEVDVIDSSIATTSASDVEESNTDSTTTEGATTEIPTTTRRPRRRGRKRIILKQQSQESA